MRHKHICLVIVITKLYTKFKHCNACVVSVIVCQTRIVNILKVKRLVSTEIFNSLHIEITRVAAGQGKPRNQLQKSGHFCKNHFEEL